MTPNDAPDVARYADDLANVFPAFTAEEQRAAVTLYRELAKGRPVGVEQLAVALSVPPTRARELLERPAIKSFVFPDNLGRVLGFGGLATQPMHHKFTVHSRTLWTWCAWDSLFIPELLGETAHVESADPATSEIIRLDVAPNGVSAVRPETAVVSFLAPDSSTFTESAAGVVAQFCHFVFFFATRKSGERWLAKHPGTFLFDLADAMRLSRLHNARTFGLELSRPARQTA